MSENQSNTKNYIKNSAEEVQDKLKEVKNEVFGKPQEEKTIGDKIDEKL